MSPRPTLDAKQRDIEKLIAMRTRITLRWFSWEPQGAHRYQPAERKL